MHMYIYKYIYVYMNTYMKNEKNRKATRFATTFFEVETTSNFCRKHCDCKPNHWKHPSPLPWSLDSQPS